MKALTLEKDYSIKLSSNVVNYIYPDYIFVPMMENYKLTVKNNDIVKKEQLLLTNDNKIGVYSPVSGKIVGAKDCLLCDGTTKKCIVIENDFKEKLESQLTLSKKMKQINKKEFIEILEKRGTLNADDSCSLMLDLFKGEFNKIVLNGIEEEPYIASKLFLMHQYSDEILETLSLLARIFETKDNIIVLKNNDRENVEKFSNILGTYPEICLNMISDLYPISNRNSLMELLNVNLDNTLLISPENLLTLYNTLKKNKRITEKYITITGNAIENPIVVNAKIGSSVKNIIEENIKYLSNDEVVYVVNGLMCGKEINIDDLIVTSDMTGLIINYKKEYLENECISCGKCREVCPANVDPKACFVNKNNNNDISKCIECGLCTYICPAYINFKNRIKELKNEK